MSNHIPRRKDLVKQTVTAGGTDNRVVGSVVTPFQALDSTDDGKTIAGKFSQGSSWEIGDYIYTHSTTTLTRTRIIKSSSGSAINFTAGARFSSIWTSRDAERASPPACYYFVQDYASSEAQFRGTANGADILQDAINAMEAAALADGGGEYVLDLTDVILRLDGALQDTSDRNCQIILPTLATGDDPPADPHSEFAFINRARKNIDVGVKVATIATPATEGGRIISTITGTGTLPSVFCCKMPTGSTNQFSRTGLHFENIEIFTDGPASGMSALNANYAQQLRMTNSAVIAEFLGFGSYTNLPTASYGIMWPTNNNNVQIIADNAHAVGFEVGHKLAEHHVGNLYAWTCKWGIEIPFLYHAYHITRLGMYNCPYGILGTGGLSYGRFGQVDIEFKSSGNFVRVREIDDASNFMHGAGEFHLVEGGVGVSSAALVKNGGSNFTATKIA